MKSPLLMSCGADDWLAGQLRHIAAESRWLFQTCKPEALAETALDARPTVAVLAADPRAPDAALAALARTSLRRPDAAVALLTSAKITEDDRAAWLALVLDLGARAALFPPYTRLVLDDLIGGLMASCAARAGLPLAAPRRAETDRDGAIDLAAGDYEEPA